LLLFTAILTVLLRLVDAASAAVVQLIVERQVMLSDLRNLLAADVGISEEDLVLMIKGKEVPRDDNKPLQELGVKDNQQVVISKVRPDHLCRRCTQSVQYTMLTLRSHQRLGAPSAPTSQTGDWSRQFVGDLLFGQTSNQEQKSYTVAKLVNVTQGYQLLPLVLERRVIQKVLALYAEDQRARANEAELIRLLEMEKKGRSEEEERKKKKKQKKKEKEKRRKDQSSPRTETGAEAKTSAPARAPFAEVSKADKKQDDEAESVLAAATTRANGEEEREGEEKSALSHPVADATTTARLCASCGATLDARHRFCWQCGTPVQQEEAQQPAVATVEQGAAAATGAASASRRKRKNKKHASQPQQSTTGVSSSEKPASEKGTIEKQQQPHPAETRSSRLPSAETDEELSGSPAADYYILEDVYRQGRSNSRDASIDGFLAAVTMPREPTKSKSRLPFFKQLT
jgi:hypothetical protein